MGDRSTNRESGFSILEMVIAMAIGTILMGAAVQLYSKAVTATWQVTQRAELQQDFRDASDLLTRGPEPGRGGPVCRRGNPTADFLNPSGVWLRSDRFMLLGQHKQRRGNVSEAGLRTLSLWADHGLPSRADFDQQPKCHRYGHGGLYGQYFLLNCYHGDRHGRDARDLLDTTQ